MRKSPLVVERLDVRRMYGINLNLSLQELADGVNVIHGPNGKGKTTLGRVMHGLIWPEKLKEHSPNVSGRFRIDDVSYDVDIEGGAPVYRKEGREGHAPRLPDVAHRDRYRLPLHLLLRTDDEDFRKVIAREAAGGLDVGTATKALDFSSSRPRRGKASTDFSDATTRVQKIQENQGGVAEDQRRLVSLRAEKEQSDRAVQEARQLGLAIEVQEARRHHATATEDLAGFDPALKEFRGDDVDTLERWRELARTTDAEITQLTTHLENLERERREHVVVVADEPDSPETKLDSHCQRLLQLENDRDRADQELASTQEREIQAWERLGGREEPTVESLNAERLREIENLVRQLQAARVHREAVQARDRALGTGNRVELEDEANLLERAVQDLTAWLRADAVHLQGSPLRTPAFAGAVVLALVAAVLGVLWHPAAWLLLVGAFVIAFVAWRLPEASGESPDGCRAQFERRGLGVSPGAWTRAEVGACLNDLQERLSRVRIQQALAHRRESFEDDGVVSAEKRLRELDEQRTALLQSLGLSTETSDIEILPFARSLADWKAARDGSRAGEKRLEQIDTQIQTELSAVNRALARFDEPEVEESAGTRAAIGKIRDWYESLAEIKRSVDSTRTRLEGARRERARAADGVTRLCERLGIEEEGCDDRVRELNNQYQLFEAAVDGEKRTRSLATDAERRFREEGGEEGLLSLEMDELVMRRDEAAGLAAEAENLALRIDRIEKAVENLLSSHALEEALAEKDEAHHALREDRERILDQNIGKLVADHVSGRHREAHLPQVLKEARTHFLHITNGRYELRLPSEDGFVALDTELQREFSLDELSSGTRVQLLLAVRLGFISVEEEAHGAALPIVLDEVLANSDPERAAAVMEAVIKLADQGRQIVYFTAQLDEVAKWAHALDGRTHRLIPLGQDGPSVDASLDSLPGDDFTRRIPEADGHDLDGYREIIDVPTWSGWEEVGRLHLWYLVDSPTELVELMRAGFRRWGPLQAMLRQNLVNLPNIPQATLDRVATRARALEAWREAWLVGRGKPVHREILEACPAVSPRMLDRVYEATRDAEHDARKLLAAEIKGFQQNKRDELREYLAEEGFLDETEPLSDDQIWHEVAREITRDLAQNQLSLHDIRDFLGRVRAAGSTKSSTSDPLDPPSVPTSRHEPDRP